MKVVVWNCSGTGNLGDDLIGLGVEAYVRRRWPQTSKIETIFRLNDHTASIVKHSDRLIIGGGQLLEGSYYLLQLKRMFELHKIVTRYEFVGVGIGGYDVIKPCAKWLKADRWLVRDEFSANVLREAMVTGEIKLYGDVTREIQFPIDKWRRNWPYNESGYLALKLKNVNKNAGFYDALGNELKKSGIDKMVMFNFNTKKRVQEDRDGENCWVSDCDDSEFGEKITRKIKLCVDVNYEGVAEREMNAERAIKAVELFARSGCIVAERYHAVILADRFNIPFRAIPYQPKVTRYLEMVGKTDLIIPCNPKAIVKAYEAMAIERSRT